MGAIVTGAASMQIRPVQPGDRDALYAISLATGHAGGDASHLYADGRLMGHIYIGPYAALEPGLVFVIEDADGVGGYVAGVTDTRAFEARQNRDWWPALRQAYPAPTTQPAAPTADERRIAMIHAPQPAPEDIVAAYPGHLHMNLSPRLQGQGQGRRLLAHWLDAARNLGAAGIHLGANQDNHRALKFWAASGFAALPPRPGRTVWFGRDA